MARNVDIIIGKDVNGSGRSLIVSTSHILAFSFQKMSNNNIPLLGYSVPEPGFGPACFRIRSSSATLTRSRRLVADQAVKKVS